MPSEVAGNCQPLLTKHSAHEQCIVHYKNPQNAQNPYYFQVDSRANIVCPRGQVRVPKTSKHFTHCVSKTTDEDGICVLQWNV